MNASPQPVLILKAHEVAPPSTIIIRQLAPDQYLIEEKNIRLRVTPKSTLIAETPLVSGQSSSPTGRIEAETYQFRSQTGQWVVLAVQNGELTAD